MSMKNTLEIYFQKQREYWQEKYQTFPQMPYSKAIDERMIVKDSLKDGYIQWQPIHQNNTVDFTALERKLNISIHPRIKEYFTSFWFLSMVGTIKGNILRFTAVPYGISIIDLVNESYRWGSTNFVENKKQFEFGFAKIGNDDSYLLYVDNDTASIRCIQLEENIELHLGDLDKVISKMEVIR
ncbi:MAG: SecY-interacting protein Syd [Oscillospiraceae bacterium]|nr:SecY-interacting protein Syd [Oscillospiraceae bacterium]